MTPNTAPDRSPAPLSGEDWLPAGRLRWILALAMVVLVVVTAAYAMTGTPH